jgi:hypothetical protein
MARMDSPSKPSSRSGFRAWRNTLLYGLCGGVVITLLKLTEYRFLVVAHSLEIYGGLVAAIFSGLGIWLGLTLTRRPGLRQTGRQTQNPGRTARQRSPANSVSIGQKHEFPPQYEKSSERMTTTPPGRPHHQDLERDYSQKETEFP